MQRSGHVEPPFDAWQARLLPVADIVMVAMLSRPPSGTLRRTWVTPATTGLAAASACAAALLAVLAIMGLVQHSGLWWLAAAALLVLAIGCADLAVFGARQRLI